MKHSGSWKTLCEDGLKMEELHVICRMVGHAKAIRKKTYCTGHSSKSIWLRGVSCNGTEDTLMGCRHEGFALLPNCEPGSQHIGVVCLPKGNCSHAIENIPRVTHASSYCL